MLTPRAATSPIGALAAWALVLGLSLALAACAGGGAGGGGTGDEGSSAEGAEVDGEAAFTANCAVCHGAEAQGTAQGPPLVHEIYEPGHHPDEAFRRAVAEGVEPHHWDFGPMPALPHVTDAQVEAIIAHVRELQREAGITG